MAVLDRVMRNLAVSLSNTFGKSVSVRVRYPGGYDPATRTGSVTTSETEVKGVLGAYRADQFGDQIQQNDAPLHLPARDITKPAPGDEITIDGSVYRAVNVISHYSGDEVALYEVQVRR